MNWTYRFEAGAQQRDTSAERADKPVKSARIKIWRMQLFAEALGWPETMLLLRNKNAFHARFCEDDLPMHGKIERNTLVWIAAIECICP